MENQHRSRVGTGGFLGKVFRSWKTQQVKLTEPGKKQAQMQKGRVSKKKEVSKKSKNQAPLSLRDRQVREIKTMINIGKQDPERLARIISRMLQEFEEKDEKAKLRFERLIWEKAEGKKG